MKTLHSATTAAGVAAVSGAPSERGAFSGEVMDSLTHTTIPASTPFLPWLTWAVTKENGTLAVLKLPLIEANDLLRGMTFPAFS